MLFDKFKMGKASKRHGERKDKSKATKSSKHKSSTRPLLCQITAIALVARGVTGGKAHFEQTASTSITLQRGSAFEELHDDIANALGVSVKATFHDWRRVEFKQEECHKGTKRWSKAVSSGRAAHAKGDADDSGKDDSGARDEELRRFFYGSSDGSETDSGSSSDSSSDDDDDDLNNGMVTFPQCAFTQVVSAARGFVESRVCLQALQCNACTRAPQRCSRQSVNVLRTDCSACLLLPAC